MQKGTVVLLCWCLWACALDHIVQAQTAEVEQTFTLVLRGVSMREALEELARSTEMDLVYPTRLVANKQVYCDGRNVSLESLLGCILNDSGLDFIRSSSGAYVLIEALEQPSRYGTLNGSVVDQTTGEPLPYAHVYLADAAIGTTTDAAGFFNLPRMLTGTHHLTVTYVGYETTVDRIQVAGGTTEHVKLALHPAETNLEPVIVDGLSQRLPSAQLGLGWVGGGDLQAVSTIGTPDVARTAASIMGVAAQQPLADLHIQGGASGEHLTLLDGVPVRDPVSLGRHLSAFSPLALRRLTVHKAGFGAAEGSHLSGVIAIEQDVAGTEPAGATLQVDPVSVNGKVQGRFALPGARHGAVMLAVRRSVWGLYEDTGVTSLLQRWNTVDPLMASLWVGSDVPSASLDHRLLQPSVAFSDVHAAARLHLSPFRILHASAYRARNRLQSDVVAVHSGQEPNQDDLLLTRDAYDWTNWAGQVQHHWLLNARATGTVQVQASRHLSQYVYGSALVQDEAFDEPESVQNAAAGFWSSIPEAAPYRERNDVREWAGKASVRYTVAPGRLVEGGLAAAHTDSRFQWGNQYIAPFSHAAAAWDLSGYLQAEWAVQPSLTMEPSLRLTYLFTQQQVYAEPRLAVRYDRAKSAMGPYALRVAGGLYRQYINQFEISSAGATAVVPSLLFWLPLDPSVAPPRAYHLAADALLTPGGNWTLSLEGYAKWQSRLLTLDYARLLQEHAAVRPIPDPVSFEQVDFISATSGRAMGGGVRLQRTGKRVTATLNYSYSHVVQGFPSRFGARLVQVPWNDPHRVSLDARVPLVARIAADLTGRSSWGRRWAFRRAYYDYLALRSTPTVVDGFDLSQPEAHKREAYVRLDAGLTYAHEWGRTGVTVRVFVSNLLDWQNIYDWGIDRQEGNSSILPRLMPGRHVGLSLRLDY